MFLSNAHTGLPPLSRHTFSCAIFTFPFTVFLLISPPPVCSCLPHLPLIPEYSDQQSDGMLCLRSLILECGMLPWSCMKDYKSIHKHRCATCFCLLVAFNRIWSNHPLHHNSGQKLIHPKNALTHNGWLIEDLQDHCPYTSLSSFSQH